MTSSVVRVLQKIKDLELFNDELYFTGGTALSYYINHRISEDIDVVSIKELNYKNIIVEMLGIGAKKIEDENIFSLRLAGFVADEYILKFILDGVKIEFFYANRPIQKKILQDLNFIKYEGSNLKILDVQSISKLKIVALMQRKKSRDLFDFGFIVKDAILSFEEILEIVKEYNQIDSKEALISFIANKKEAKNDETVYLDEFNMVDLTFAMIKVQVIQYIQANLQNFQMRKNSGK